MPTRTREIRITLPWICHLRWIAVVGQVTATVLAVWWLGLRLPLPAIAVVVSITIISNVIAQTWNRLTDPPDWLVPTIIVLDVCTLTALLWFAGGTSNPFAVLYAIHVAMTVVVLGGGWAWIVLAISSTCYAILYYRHAPLDPAPPDAALDLGRWVSLVLVMVLITYFVGRVMRSLRDREAELALARERASRSGHLAALTTLAAGAAHELGTPLGTIALAAKEMELASTRGEDSQSLAEDARLIRQEVDRCRAILDRMRVDVLEDATQRSVSVQPLAQLLDDLRNDLKSTELHRLDVVVRASDGAVVARARVLRRAIGVLLRNAFDASPADQNVQLLFRRENGRMIFEVADRGGGMPRQVLQRAGDPFFTTKPPGEGMGLGLFLVRLVAETYDGRFEMTSTPGEGTRSVLELPEPTSSAAEPASKFVDTSRDDQYRTSNTGRNASDDSNARRGRRPNVSQASGEGADQPGL